MLENLEFYSAARVGIIAFLTFLCYAGVPELLFHDLRRTGARNLRRAGVAEGIIMKTGAYSSDMQS